MKLYHKLAVPFCIKNIFFDIVHTVDSSSPEWYSQTESFGNLYLGLTVFAKR